MRHRCCPTASFAVALMTFGAWVVPQTGVGQEHQGEPVSHEEGEAGHHANHMAVFVGATTENVEDGTSSSFSLGLDYERRLSTWIGLAIGGELVFEGDEREGLLGVLLNFHATRGLILGFGPGVEFAKERPEEHEGDASAGSAEESSESETEAVFRAGGLYEFEVGRRYTVAPTFYVDMISGKRPVYVWGLSVGLGF